MLRSFLVCLLLGLFFFPACNYVPTEKRIALYSKIKGTNDTVDKMTREWYHLLNQSLKDRNFSRLSQYRILMGEFLSNHRSAIANLRYDAAAQNLLDSEEVFLANRASVVSDVYPSFEVFNDITPSDEINALLKTITYDLGTEITMVAAINRSLQAYADIDDLKVKKSASRSRR